MNNNNLWLLLSFLIVALLNGVISQYFEPNVTFPLTDVVFMFFGAAIIFIWYYRDSEKNQFKRSPLLNIGVVAIGFIAIPYYLFKTRGIKLGALFTLYFIIVLLLWSAFQTAGIYATYYTVQS
jgi:peptidoglycan/LPS O-acetylase OafA/YrhL